MDGGAKHSGEGEMIPEIDNAAAWLNEQVRKHQFAELNIRVIIHDGEVRQVERGVIEKIRPEK